MWSYVFMQSFHSSLFELFGNKKVVSGENLPGEMDFVIMVKLQV